LEIVCINIEIQAKVVDVKIPTHYQFFKDKYEKVNPNHWNNLKEYFKEGGWNPPQYSLWDLMEKLKDGKT